MSVEAFTAPHGYVLLGNARKGGALAFAQQAKRMLSECGEAALLLSRQGDVVVLPHWTEGYHESVDRNAQYLCGIYRTPIDAAAPVPFTAQTICDDLVARWHDHFGHRRVPAHG